MLPFFTEMPRFEDEVLATPDPVPEAGVQSVVVALSQPERTISNPFRSIVTLEVLTLIPSVFSSGTMRLLVSR